MTRIRDKDPATRRTLYHDVLPALNPRHLSQDQAAAIVLSGLKERDETVQSAASKLVASWVRRKRKLKEGEQELKGKDAAFQKLFEFIDLFDIGTEDLKHVELALECAYKGCLEIVDQLEFEG